MLAFQSEYLVEFRGRESAIDLGSSSYDVGQQLYLAAERRVRDFWLVAVAHHASTLRLGVAAPLQRLHGLG